MYSIYHLSTIAFGVFLIFFYLQKLLPRNPRSSAVVWVAYFIFGIGLTALNLVSVMPIIRTMPLHHSIQFMLLLYFVRWP